MPERHLRTQAGTVARLAVAILAVSLFAWAAVALGSGEGAPDPQAERPALQRLDHAITQAARSLGAQRVSAQARRLDRERRARSRRRQLASAPGEELPRRPALPPPGYEQTYVPIGPGAQPGAYPPVDYRPSRALGLPFRGRLRAGTLLPREGPDFTTWDPILESYPSRPWRRVGTARLVRMLIAVSAEHRARDPGAPRLVVSDLSLPGGGPFGREYGSLGHRSHQNGLDIDIFYPRLDRSERAPKRAWQVDRRRAQALIDLFIAAGAEKVFVTDPRFRGPRSVLQVIPLHDRHMHVRIPPGPDDRPATGD